MNDKSNEINDSLNRIKDPILEKYELFQKSTEKREFDIKYFALGIGGEVGEVQNEIKKLERDDNNILTKERKDKIIRELGDAMWYITGLCRKIDCDLEIILEKNIEKLSNKLS
tara:strand:- start:133 stop:471 length:339 start_codon:yes stop_codon:yes gene_type:complete